MLPEQWKEKILNGECGETLAALYCCEKKEVDAQARRLVRVIDGFEKLFGKDRDVMLFSAPGRTEVGGNHTDHQQGRVLAASVNLDAVAVVAKTEGTEIRVKSEGFPEDRIDANDLNPKPEERETAVSLLRGVCGGFVNRGYRIGGYCAYTTSSVLSGSGLSSSAAYEVLLGTAMNRMFCSGEVPPLTIAQFGQFAENEYFGKPCGLMDEAASAIGGFALIDFSDAENPRAERIPFDFAKCGYRLCIIDTKGSHSDLTPDYAAIPIEMKKAAACFGKKVLSQVDEKEFYSRIPEVRAAAGDRAVLRAMHFFAENRRVLEEADALKAGNFEAFRRLVIESGRSSFEYLQNVFSPAHVSEQGVAIALALCEKLLEPRKGAWRVHGGGFAGTVQTYVPEDFLTEFSREIEAVFGPGSCLPLAVRPVGGVQIVAG